MGIAHLAFLDRPQVECAASVEPSTYSRGLEGGSIQGEAAEVPEVKPGVDSEGKSEKSDRSIS